MYFWFGFGGYSEKFSFYCKLVCKLNCSVVDLKKLLNLWNMIWSLYLFYDYCYFDFFNDNELYFCCVDRVISWFKFEDFLCFVVLYIDVFDWKGYFDGVFLKVYKDFIEKVDKDVVGYFLD